MDANSTIYDALDAIARGPEGASPAVLFHDTASDSSRRQISFRDLARLSLAAAAFLSEKCGVKRGDSIVIFLPSNVEWLAFYFASTRLGAVAINLNTRLRESEIRHVLKTSGARLVVVEQGFVGTDYVGIVAGAVEGAGFGQVTVVNVGKQDASLNGAAAGLRVLKYSLPSGAGLADFDRLQNDPRMRQGRPDDLSATFTTSGTTGPPKLASHIQRSLLRHSLTTAKHWFPDPSQQVRLTVTVPLCGLFGFSQAFMALLNGKPIVLVNLFTPESAATILDSERATHLLAPDNIIHSILCLHKSHPGSNTRHSFSSWTHAGYGLFSSGLAGPIAEMRARYTPQLYLSGLYGSSELLALLSAWSYSDPLELRLTGGGGRLIPGIRVRVVDGDGNPIHGFGEEKKGELEFSGYSTLKSYLGNPEAMKKNLRKEKDGSIWFKSGDLGYLVPARTEAGFPENPTTADFDHGRATDSFAFLARIGDSLRLRGFLVDPTEIESVLQAHELVDSVQVVGLDLGIGKGEDAVAFIITSPSSKLSETQLEKEIVAWAKSRLANYKIPARVFITDRFPTTNGPNGEKVQKAVLRKEAAARSGVASKL